MKFIIIFILLISVCVSCIIKPTEEGFNKYYSNVIGKGIFYAKYLNDIDMHNDLCNELEPVRTDYGDLECVRHKDRRLFDNHCTGPVTEEFSKCLKDAREEHSSYIRAMNLRWQRCFDKVKTKNTNLHSIYLNSMHETNMNIIKNI